MTKNKYLNLFLVLPTPYLVLIPNQPDFEVVNANAAFLSLFNIANLDEKDFTILLNKYCVQDLTAWKNALQNTIIHKTPTKIFSQQLRTLNKENDRLDEQYFTIENIPVLNDENEVDVVLIALNEEPNTQSLERENNNLRINEKFLAKTQKIAKIGSWEVDLISQVIVWSDVVKEIHEVEPDYVPRLNAEGKYYKTSDTKEKVVKAFYDAISTGGSFELDVEIITAKENFRWIRTTGTTEMKDGFCVRIYGTTQDITETKTIEQALLDSRNEYKSVLQSIEGIVWEADLETLSFTFVSDQVNSILGYTPEQILKKSNLWTDLVYPEDRLTTLDYFSSTSHSEQYQAFDYRIIKADGNIIWVKDIVSVINARGKPKRLRGLIVDITSTKRANDLERLEKTVLELNSQKHSRIEDVLTTYVEGIETLFPGMKCSIMQVKNNRLYNWAAPSLPKFFTYAIEAVPIGNNVGSCGTAAYLKQTVIATDIQTDPRWAGYHYIAIQADLKASCSYPVIDSDGNIMATFGVYYKEAKSPNDDELKIIERATSLSTVIIENRKNSEILKETALLMEQGQELAHFGNWLWDIINDTITWSDSLYAIYGIEKGVFSANYEDYRNLLHPEDRDIVEGYMETIVKTKKDIEFYERIIRPNGELRHIKTWAKLVTGVNGEPLKLIGACLDVTESKKIQEELRTSESRFRNLVESQTNYVVRIDLNAKYTYTNNKYIHDFGWLYEDENLIGKDVTISVLPYQHNQVMDTAEKCISEPNKVFQVELDKPGKNGSIKATLWHFLCLTDANEQPSEIQCIGIDVTERKRTEDALRESNERFKYVNMATNDAIYDWHIFDDHIIWGDAFYRLFGFDKSEEKFPMDRWVSLIHPDDLPEMEHDLLKVLEDTSKNRWFYHYRFKKADGTYANVEENGFIIRRDDGKAIRIVGVVRDITDRLTYIEAIENQNQRLKEISWMQSHVVRAPLSRIMGLVEILKDDKIQLNEKYEFLQHLLDSADELDDIIKDISAKTQRVEIG